MTVGVWADPSPKAVATSEIFANTLRNLWNARLPGARTIADAERGKNFRARPKCRIVSGGPAWTRKGGGFLWGQGPTLSRRAAIAETRAEAAFLGVDSCASSLPLGGTGRMVVALPGTQAARREAAPLRVLEGISRMNSSFKPSFAGASS
jgi:hypothetical protein